MPWKPSEPGEVPTLGYGVIDWITDHLAAPSRLDYEPFVLYREQEDFILRFYELNPVTGKRRYHRGLLGRPRGWGKSPLLAALSWAEALGPVVPDGWDADGQPVGAEWVYFRTPIVHIAAVSEDQVRNTWTPLVEMAHPESPLLAEYPGIEPLDTMVNLPRGKIEKITASPRTVKGTPTVFAVLDQTEEWVPGNHGPALAKRMRENAAKLGGSTIESPNAFITGEKSVAEASATYAETIRNGTALDDGLLYDDREAPPTTDYYDRESVILGLRVAYGDSSDHPDGCLIHDPPCPPGHAPLESHLATMWATDYDPLDGQANFLNQKTHAANAWLSQPVWVARYGDSLDPTVRPATDGDVITLGFDGSRGKKRRGKPDATALIGCRVSDGHVFEVEVWEAGHDQNTWPDWEPPLVAVEAAVADVFARFKVAAFYCDPARDWRSHVNAWEAKYGGRLHKTPDGKTVTVSPNHPFEWWMTGGRNTLIERAIEQLEGAVRNGDMSHDGSSRLTQHIINARRGLAHGKLILRKDNDYSDKKIDAAVAAVLAWQARLDCVAKGIREPAKSRVAPRRLDQPRR